MTNEWIVFSNKLTGEILSQISIEGSYPSEIEATKELLAYENQINKSDIEVKLK